MGGVGAKPAHLQVLTEDDGSDLSCDEDPALDGRFDDSSCAEALQVLDLQEIGNNPGRRKSDCPW